MTTKLYGGTKTEMERLLADAEAITGVKYDISNLSDVYEAIHVIQTELGITGTTALEAEKTITGSFSSMKAAWQDLMVALASGEGIERAIDNFVSALSSFGSNIIPVIKRAMDGLGRAFRELMPDLVKMIVSALIEAIPVILETIWEMIVAMFEGIVEGVKSLFTTEENVYAQSQQQINKATQSQNKLTEAVEETNEALEGTVAGFDELNVLNSKEEKDLGLNNIPNYKIPDNLFEQSKNNAEDMEEAVKSTIFEVGKLDEFKYELIAEVDPNMVLNLQNSLLKAKTSIEELFSGEDEDGEFDFTSIASNYIDMKLRQFSGEATIVAGISDIGVGIKEDDFHSAWQGLGEVIQGGIQFNYSLPALVGIDTSEIDAWFYPIQEELENLYKGLTPVQIAQIESFQDIFDTIATEFSEIAFTDSIIKEKDVTTIKKKFDNLKKVVTANSEAIKKEVVKKTSNLVKQGLMTEEEASQIVKDTEAVQQEQVDNIANAQSAIDEILQKASAEKRALTKEEEAEIALILQNAEDTYTAIVSEGTGDRQEILDKLEEYRENMSTQRLSQLIVAANAEEKARKEAADKEYEETVEAARVLYEDLGTIDKERYDEIVQNAKAERDAKYEEAKGSRDELVKEATLAAGEIAETVDPETGEIYSAWEMLWNSMEETAKGFINKLIGYAEDGMNGLRHFFNTFIDVANGLSSLSVIGGVNIPHIPDVKIPRLATGGVIPGGREFLAVLGDQPAGQTNIEAPLSTIKQALAEVMRDYGGGGNQPIIVEIDGKEVFRAVKNAEMRYGSQIMTGGAY